MSLLLIGSSLVNEDAPRAASFTTFLTFSAAC